ncbi:MAG: DUF2344 domain-containing protein [Chloroflexi bacterium]|nr:DUF2344 domain-containing protein [Chloroflexota bacterium]
MSERPPAKAQRLRVRFSRGPEAASIGHLDLARVWERAFHEAGVAVSYSQGNRPHPRLVLAAGLPVGVTSEGELLDVVLAERADPAALPARVTPQLPAGLVALEAQEVGMGLPALPAAVRWADYEADVPDAGDVDEAVRGFLANDALDWEDTRGEKVRRYDLRALVQELRVEQRCAGSVRLGMRLRCGTAGVGRPDQVVKALGLPAPSRVHRTKLVLAEASPAREAWRRRGRFVE